MKKIRLIMVSIICLVATLVVSSFAWFAIGNNGVLSEDVQTSKKVAIYFSESGTNGLSMVPAKLKKGVINDPSGSIIGIGEDATEVCPTGKDVLPQVDENYKYILENSNLTTKNEYLEYPATIVYSQFDMIVNGYSDSDETKKINISFDVKYYNVDEEGEETSELTSFSQTEALTFNFFVLTTKLTEEQLLTISTNLNSNLNVLTIEDFLVTNKDSITAHKEGILSTNDENFALETVDSYRYKATVAENATTYSLTIDKIVPNQMYYILIESYYSVPDQLVEGNLPLTGKFVLDLKYTTVSSEA